MISYTMQCLTFVLFFSFYLSNAATTTLDLPADLLNVTKEYLGLDEKNKVFIVFQCDKLYNGHVISDRTRRFIFEHVPWQTIKDYNLVVRHETEIEHMRLNPNPEFLILLNNSTLISYHVYILHTLSKLCKLH